MGHGHHQRCKQRPHALARTCMQLRALLEGDDLQSVAETPLTPPSRANPRCSIVSSRFCAEEVSIRHPAKHAATFSQGTGNCHPSSPSSPSSGASPTPARGGRPASNASPSSFSACLTRRVERSTPMARRPRLLAMASTVPAPQKGSTTKSTPGNCRTAHFRTTKTECDPMQHADLRRFHGFGPRATTSGMEPPRSKGSSGTSRRLRRPKHSKCVN
mmetsp:Transcript_8211/g.20988  ORF Transcript_8211/g.20988 Transcript_8211/m.20988 type:complete len:216 (-) Transcript_8211:420-1067(-)